MAGQGLFKSVTKAVKKGTKRIKSNMVTKADDVVINAAKKTAGTLSKNNSETLKILKDASLEQGIAQDVFDNLATATSKLKSTTGNGFRSMGDDLVNGVGLDDFKYMNGITGSAEDMAKFDKAYGSALKSLGENDSALQYRKILGNEKATSKALDEITNKDVKYIGDEKARLNKAKNEEYKRIKKEKIKNGEEWDRSKIMEQLDADSKYKIEDPYNELNKQYSKKNIDKRRKNMENGDKYDFDAERRAKEEKIFEKTGYRNGTRKEAFENAIGQPKATGSRAREYFWDGANAEQRATRIGVAGAATVGTMVGARYLTGGNLSYNADGEKDIAGIPFI